MRIQKYWLTAGLLLSPMAGAHGGHEPVLFQGWLGWKHWLAHALAEPIMVFGVVAVLVSVGLLFRLQGGRVGFFVRRVSRNLWCRLQLNVGDKNETAN